MHWLPAQTPEQDPQQSLHVVSKGKGSCHLISVSSYHFLFSFVLSVSAASPCSDLLLSRGGRVQWSDRIDSQVSWLLWALSVYWYTVCFALVQSSLIVGGSFGCLDILPVASLTSFMQGDARLRRALSQLSAAPYRCWSSWPWLLCWLCWSCCF